MTVEKRWLTGTETAKLLRGALKAAFPAVKFRVYKSKGGGSISVKWTDGPTVGAVKEITRKFAGKGFDGMIDLEYSIEAWVLNGEILGTRCAGTVGSRGSVSPWGMIPPHDDAELVRFGGGYIFEEREISPALATKALAQVAAHFGIPAEKRPTIAATEWGGFKVIPAAGASEWERPVEGLPRNWSELIREAASDASRYAPPALEPDVAEEHPALHAAQAAKLTLLK